MSADARNDWQLGALEHQRGGAGAGVTQDASNLHFESHSKGSEYLCK
jgi:hypothetical protein